MAQSEHYALLANRVVTSLRPEVEAKVLALTEKHHGLDSGELRLRLWIVESTIVLLAGESSTADVARLEQFFDAFWSDISRELQTDFPDRNALQDFDDGMDRLTAELESDRKQLAHEEVAMAMANRITAFLGVPEREPLGYGYKLATAARFLDHLPE